MIDINFKNTQEEKNFKNLSVLIDADSFFYGIFDDSNQLIEARRTDSFDLYNEDAWSPVNLLPNDLSFENVNLTVVNNSYLHFSSLPNTDGLESIPIFNGHEIFLDKFTDQEVYISFGVEKQIIRKFQEYFGDFQLQHFSTLLSQLYLYKPGKILHIHTSGKTLYLFYQEEGVFKFYNQFQCNSEKDFLYFIAAAEEELDLNLNQQTVYISGLVDERSKLFKLLSNYIYNIIPFNSIPLDVKAQNSKLSNHFYLPLYSSALCGL